VRPDRFEERRAELGKFEDRLIFVEDVIAAFQKLAHGVYLEWNKPVVAVTGSAGKTTAKELAAHVLESSGRKVLRSIKNYNNGLGLPITVLNLARDASYDVAVLEMGMSTPNNEIARLCRITPPDVAVELNVLPVHVEHLGSIEAVAEAKAELVEGMKPGGTAVLNADDFRVFAMRDMHEGTNLTYGIDVQSDVMAKEISFDRFGETRFTLKTPAGQAQVLFPLNGRHNILNALAAAAVGHKFGMSAAEIAASLHTVGPPPQRGEILHFAAGFTVVMILTTRIRTLSCRWSERLSTAARTRHAKSSSPEKCASLAKRRRRFILKPAGKSPRSASTLFSAWQARPRICSKAPPPPV
jgi:UDP-N-acetylmuramoyl-tripeptide--D-alanyl-D-alanine ligase